MGTPWWALRYRLLGCAAVFEDATRIGQQLRPEKAFKGPHCSFHKDVVPSNKQKIASDTLSVWNWAERSPAIYFCKWFQDYTPKAQEVKCSSTFRNYLCLSVRWDILHLVCYWPRLPLRFCKEDYTANILAVLSTAFGSVTFPMVIWL